MSENPEKTNGSATGAGQVTCRPADEFRFPGERVGHIRVASRPDSLKRVRALVNEAGGAIGCSGTCVTEMIMAVDEACQNIIRHAYGGDPDGEIVVDIRRQDDRIAIHILDFAAPVDTTKIKPRSLDEVKPGGLGTHFIQQCMDECGFLTPPAGAGNCLRLIKIIT